MRKRVNAVGSSRRHGRAWVVAFPVRDPVLGSAVEDVAAVDNQDGIVVLTTVDSRPALVTY